MVDAGVRAEMLLSRLDAYEELSGGEEESMEETDGIDSAPLTDATSVDEEEKDVNSVDYLASELTYHEDKLLDGDNNGVMMEWERGIMERTVDVLLPGKHVGKKVLNIGFGMGIVDSFFQKKKPELHVIVEAHPDVLRQMKEDGWDAKLGVEILEGRWQDVSPPSPLLRFARLTTLGPPRVGRT